MRAYVSSTRQSGLTGCRSEQSQESLHPAIDDALVDHDAPLANNSGSGSAGGPAAWRHPSSRRLADNAGTASIRPPAVSLPAPPGCKTTVLFTLARDRVVSPKAPTLNGAFAELDGSRFAH